ncbi:MAG: hypothetical protein WAM58_10535 [Candidatus Acidiferrum sp.]
MTALGAGALTKRDDISFSVFEEPSKLSIAKAYYTVTCFAAIARDLRWFSPRHCKN